MVSWKNGGSFQMKVSVPDGMSAEVELPATAQSQGVFKGAERVSAKRFGSRWKLDQAVTGTATFEVR
jgi:hypothetical protein